MKYLILFTVIFFISSHSFLQTETTKGDTFKTITEFDGNTYVILVGVSDYSNLPESKQLNFADDDARLMNEYLSTWSNVKIRSFIDSSATKNNVGIAIHNVLQNEAQNGDRVILYFSGHGDVDQAYGDGYILLSQVTEPNQQIYQFNDAFPLSYLEMMMEKAANKGIEVVFISDACKSGAIENEKDANQRMLQIGSNTSSLVSCGPTELSTESIEYGGGHGVFTYYLVQGLMGLADSNADGIINFKELSRYVEDNVAEARDYKQNPMSRGLPNNKIAGVDDELAAKAKQQNDLSLAIASVQIPKAMYTEQTGAHYYALLSVLNNLVIQSTFFEDEIDVTGNSLSSKSEHMKSCSSNPVYDVAINGKGNIIASVANREIHFFDLQGNLLKKQNLHKSGVTAVAFHPTKNIVCSSSWKNDAILWDYDNDKKIAALSGLGEEAYAITFIDDQRIAIGTHKGDLFLWNPPTGDLKKAKISKKRLNDIKLNGSDLLVASSDGKVYVYDLMSNKVSKEFLAHRGGCTSIVIAPMSKSVYTVGHNKTMEEWDITSFNKKSSFELDYAENREIAIDLNENYVFVASRRYDLDVVDLQTKSINKHFSSSHSSGLVSVAFNNSTNVLAFGDSRGRLHISELNITTGNQYALKVRDQLLADENNNARQYEIDGTVLIGLNTQVNKVLIPLVNGDAIQPSLEEIIRAKRYAEKAIELGNMFPDIHNQLQINLNLIKIYEIIASNNYAKYNEALSLSKDISRLDPKGSYGFNIQGQLHVQLQDFSSAKDCAGKAEEKAPLWAEASCSYGKIYVAEGDYNLAEEKFLETIKKGPNLSKGYFNLGKLYLTIGRIDEGKTELDKAIEIDGKVEVIVLEKLRYGLMSGDEKTTGSILRNFKNLIPVQLIKIEKDYQSRSSIGRFEDAYLEYRELLEKDSNNIDVLISYGYFLLYIQDNDEAKRFVEDTFVDKEAESRKSSRALIRQEIRRTFAAAEDLNQENLLLEIGQWLSRSNEVSSATIDNFLTEHNKSMESISAVARYYLAIDDAKTALKYLKGAIKVNAGNIECLVLLMEAQKMLGKEGKNSKYIAKHLNVNPNSDVVKYRKELTEYYTLAI